MLVHAITASKDLFITKPWLGAMPARQLLRLLFWTKESVRSAIRLAKLVSGKLPTNA